jgi:NitT/TauT family transport system substrate-binding protein
MKKDLLGRLAAALGIFLMAGLSAGTPAQALEKIRILIPVRSIDEAFSPFTVAKYLGYFEAEGLDVSLLPVGGSNETAIQISAGNAELGAASPGESLIGIQSGQLHIRYFFDLYYANIWSLAVPIDSPLKSVEELKGKRIGVQAMGSAGTTFGRAFAKSAGLNPQKDLSFIPIGMGAQAVTAVNQHLVDAIIFWDAALAKFDVSGLKLRMLPVAESIRTLPDVSLIARNEVIEKNPTMLAAVARAVAKGYDFSIANPEAAVLISWKLYPETKPKNVSPEEALKQGVFVNKTRLSIWNSPKTGDRHGLFIVEDWKRLVDFLVDQQVLPAPIPVDKIGTNALVDEANKYDRAAVIAAAKQFDLSTLK